MENSLRKMKENNENISEMSNRFSLNCEIDEEKKGRKLVKFNKSSKDSKDYLRRKTSKTDL